MRCQQMESGMTINNLAEARDRAENVRARLQSSQPVPEVRVYNLAANVLNLCDEVERLRAELGRVR